MFTTTATFEAFAISYDNPNPNLNPSPNPNTKRVMYAIRTPLLVQVHVNSVILTLTLALEGSLASIIC